MWSTERVEGVREDHKSKVMYPVESLLQVFRGLPIEHFVNLGVHGSFLTLGVHGAKKGYEPPL